MTTTHPPPHDRPPAETAPVVPRPERTPPRAADRDAEFTAFMTASGPALLRTAWLLVGDAHRAEELVQQALVRTYVAWGRVRGGDPAAYTRRTLVNLRTDTWRRRRREVLTAPDGLPEREVASGAAATDDRDALVRALARLTPRQRRVVVLRHLVGLTEREVADDLGISTGTVKSTTSRALAALRTDLAVDAGSAPVGPATARPRPEETR